MRPELHSKLLIVSHCTELCLIFLVKVIKLVSDAYKMLGLTCPSLKVNMIILFVLSFSLCYMN